MIGSGTTMGAGTIIGRGRGTRMGRGRMIGLGGGGWQPASARISKSER
jgi:hypothetical protein